MASYDLREFRTLPWFRGRTWFRLGFGAFVAVLAAAAVYGVYGPLTSGKFGTMQAIGAALIFLILGLFALVVLLMRPPAAELVVDELGAHFLYDRGAPDNRPWAVPRTKIRGRYTPGAPDSISRGKPVWSVYGPFGGLSETFVPGPAFEEIRVASEAHGFALTKTSARPGWTLYTIAPKRR